MAKKKAIKLAAATAIAASSFAAFAPASTEAATNVDALIKDYKAKAWAAYQAWQPANGELKWASKVKPAIAAADASYKTALSAIDNAKLTTAEKEAKTKALKAEVKYADSATSYITALYGTYDIADELEGATYDDIYAANDKVKALNAKIAKVWHAGNRTILTDSVKETVADVVNAANAKYYLNKALYNVTAGKTEVAKANEWLAKAATYVTAAAGTDFAAGVAAHKAEVDAKIEEATAPKVDSVSAINGKQIVIKFNKAVKESSVITSNAVKAGVFTLVRADGTANVAAVASLSATTAAVLSSDGKTLTLTDDHASNYFDGTYAFTVLADKVETTKGEKIAKSTQTITVKDNTRPTVTGVEYPNNGKARILFSEPVVAGTASETSVTFTDASGNAIASSVIPAASAVTNDGLTGKYYIDVDLSATAVPLNSNITATIVGYKDYTGNILSTNPSTVTLRKDNTDTVAPTVVSATVTSTTTADIKFSKALDESTIALTDIEVAGVDVTEFKKDSSDPTLYHATFAAQTGLKTFTITGSVLKDKSGNGLAAYSKLLNFSTDVTSPTVVSSSFAKVDGVESLIVTFDENVKPIAAKTVSANRLKDYVTSTVTLTTTTTANSTANNVNVALYNAVDGKSKSVAISLANVADGQYTVSLPTGLVTDLYGNDSVSKSDVTFTRTSDNTTGKPALIASSPIVQGSSNDKVIVKFDKKLDPTTALTASNYNVEGATVTSVALTKNDAADAQVTLTLASGSNKFTGNHVFTISGVKSDAGVVMDSVTTSASINENVAPTLKTAELTDTTKIKLTFSEKVSNANDTDGADFDLYVGGVKSSKTVAVEAITATNEKTELVATVSSALTAEELAAGVTIKPTSKLNIADVVNNTASVSSTVTVSQ